MEGEEPEEEKKTKTFLGSKYTIIVLVIVLIVVFIILFIKIEEQKEHPLIIFKEDPLDEGILIGNVQKNTDYNVSDVIMQLWGFDPFCEAVQDPMTHGKTAIAYDDVYNIRMNCTFFDRNQNNILDKGDEFIIRNNDSDGMFRLLHKTGNLIYWYEF
jgi:hypothetical protein